jgi:hypothetical protein
MPKTPITKTTPLNSSTKLEKANPGPATPAVLDGLVELQAATGLSRTSKKTRTGSIAS